MATSRIEFAQDEVLIECDVCETLEQVNSYCRDCFWNICDKCKKLHFRMNKNHELVSVFEGRLEKMHYKVKCSEHDCRYKFFCQKCKLNICEECLAAAHNGHEFKKVSEHAKSLKQNIHTKLNITKIHYKELKTNLKTVEEHEINFKKIINAQKESVRREIEIKQAKIKEDGEKILENLESEEKSSCKIIRDHYKKIKDIDNELNDLIDSVSNKLTNIPDAAVFNFVQESQPKLEIINTDTTFDLPNPSTFAPSSPWDQDSNLIGILNSSKPTRLNIDSVKSHIKQSTPVDPSASTSSALLANLSTPLNPPPSLRRELQVVNKFTPARGEAIYSVCSTADDLFWVGTSGSLLFLVDKTGDVKRRVKMPGDPWHLAVTCRGDVIVSTNSHVIYHVTRQGDISTLVDVSPDTVRGITTTRQGDVFACVRDSGSVWRVKKFTAEGDFVLEVDRKLFTTRNQYRVHSVSGDVVCIQDGHPWHDAVCNLTFVDGAGQLISRVTRTEQLRGHTARMLWDRHGHVVTGTVTGEYMHVFSGDGTCRQSYRVKGSKGINGLCLGRDDVVLIGTKTGEVIVAKYLQ